MPATIDPRAKRQRPADDPARNMAISVVMPVYNGACVLRASLAPLLAMQRAGEIAEIIVVDDGSTDGTRDLLARWDGRAGVRVILHQQNQGKGAALRTALAQAQGEMLIIHDADLEYDPGEYPSLLRPIEMGRADVVFGSRFRGSAENRVQNFWHTVGNRVLTLISNVVTDLNLTDMETCYKAVRGDLARSLHLTSDRFGFEPEITARLAQRDARIYEVPISYAGRTYAEGKKISWRDGIAAFWHILKFSLSR